MHIKHEFLIEHEINLSHLHEIFSCLHFSVINKTFLLLTILHTRDPN